ncbi:MAG TPA: hypothetical protein PL155_03830 [Candidatus Omnitrophota bacterium]|nr:hypothetical protein [Candidatus Omnitrophota bacterium]HPD84396.1 hypothetical protein [Candidatus Omnitrophota bacterium]HRZ03254.1 hypothetical protein [Candidatus Omnitrophota bacterium]
MNTKRNIVVLALAIVAFASQGALAQTNEQEPLVPQVMKGRGVTINQVDSKYVEQNGMVELIPSHQVVFNAADDVAVVHFIDPDYPGWVYSNSFDIDMMISSEGKLSARRAFVSMTVTQGPRTNTVKIIMDAENKKVVFEQYYGSTLALVHEEPVSLRPDWTYHVNIIRDINDPDHDVFGIFPAGPLPPDVEPHSVTFVKSFKDIGFPMQTDLRGAFYFVGAEKSKVSFWKESLRLVRE